MDLVLSALFVFQHKFPVFVDISYQMKEANLKAFFLSFPAPHCRNTAKELNACIILIRYYSTVVRVIKIKGHIV